MRWLVKDPLVSLYRPEPAGRTAIGDSVRLRVQVRDVGFEPVEDANVVLTLQGPGRAEIFEGETNADGEWLLPVEAKARGAYV